MQANSLDRRLRVNTSAPLDALARSGVTFVAFREPGRSTQVFVQRSAELSEPRPGDRSFLIAPFETGQAPIGCIRPEAEFELGAELPELTGYSVSKDTVLIQGLDRSGYRAAVENALELIGSGAAEKVVLARTLGADLTGIELSGLFIRACDEHPSALVVLARAGGHGLWLGASPERLLRLEGSQIEVDSLAGSLPTASAPPKPDDWGAKERAEQESVTTEVLETLRLAGLQDLRTTALAVQRAGNVSHLHTRVTGTMLEPDPLRLARMLHPTPAVGGRPRPAALEMIARSEPRGRTLYAGYWGLLEADRACLHVNIRCMEIAGNEALLHVGAGIIAGSSPERECDEVELKSRTWLDLIRAQRARG